ncbi:MAG: ribonuclease P [Bacteroidetes bacterium]|jgi:ribonuclease P protein component|nr:ribonuclease P [Bacteroidota bacterium]
MADPTEASSSSPRRPRTLPRAARLKRTRLIRPLFDRRRTDVGTVAVGCVRLLFRVVPRDAVGMDVPVQVGFAPGRRARTAVARNRIKRLLREVYRRHQYLLVDLFAHRAETLTLMVLYRSAPEQAGAQIPRDLPRALQQAADRLAA